MIRIVFIVAALLGWAGSAYAQCDAVEVAHLLQDGAAKYDLAGAAVAIDGDTAVVGAPGINDSWGAQLGEARVYVRDGGVWREQAVFRDNQVYGNFGMCVALDGDTLAAGHPNTVSIFVRRGAVWELQARLAPPDFNTHGFGRSLAIDGDTLVVGAPKDNGWFGSAYVFTRVNGTWQPPARLLAPDGFSGDRFGSAVAISGGTILVGVPEDTTPAGKWAGSVHVFVREGDRWEHQAQLFAQNATQADYFGLGVAVEGDTAMVGAIYDEGLGGKHTGTASVFVRSAGVWTETQRLSPSDQKWSAKFGISIAMEGDSAIIGAYNARKDYSSQGAVYVFRRWGDQWVESATIFASDGDLSDDFGLSVDLSGGTIVVGAPGDEVREVEHAGSAYIFKLNCPPCSADCDESGGPDVDDFVCFQALFGTGDPKADCDQSGELDINDFVCFQATFAAGCP